jgi:ribosomal protein S18 acetylase RimI-like enzyme
LATASGSGESGSAIRIRSAALSDLFAIARFQTECWREAYRDLVPQEYLDRVSIEDREDRWRHRLVSGARRIALAESGNAVVGVVSWGEHVEPGVPALELMSLYVAAEHRGSGVATSLLDLAIGVAPAYLWVFEQNPRAQAFYAKHGFLFDGRRKVDGDTGLWERRFVRP